MSEFNIETLKSKVSDNYFYAVVSEGCVGLIDPIDAATAIEFVQERGFKLTHVINTHFHPDHVGGNEVVLQAFPSADLLVPEGERELIGNLCDVVPSGMLKGGDLVQVGGVKMSVYDTPGHTPAHISLKLGNHLLSGDTIFMGGAGHCRFGGDPGVFFRTYRDVLTQFSDEIQIHPGHDYAVNNIEFALSLQPDLEAAQSMLEAARRAASAGEGFFTTLGEERRYNPFFRFGDEGLRVTLQTHHAEDFQAELRESESEDEAVFRTVRRLRNSW